MFNYDEACQISISNLKTTFLNHAAKQVGISMLFAMLYAIAVFTIIEKQKGVMESSIKSQFNYHPLIWLLYSRTLNNKIDCILERPLRIIFCAY